MFARAACLWLAFATAAHGEATLKLSELPRSYFCFVFTVDLDSSDFSKSVGRNEVYAVDGTRWRLEVMTESEKGFVTTYDGEKLRSTKRKLDGSTLEAVSDIAPTSWFPKLFRVLSTAPILATKKSSLEGMTCERYSLKADPAPFESWIHTKSRLPIQIVSRISDSSVSIQRFIWVPMAETAEEIHPTDMTFSLYRRYADHLNRKLEMSNKGMQQTAPK
ncbi:MAG TPA: hypothetical protein VF593_11455 [Chthoniobacteraceae bacterium]|jgi:hypothetical protein